MPPGAHVSDTIPISNTEYFLPSSSTLVLMSKVFLYFNPLTLSPTLPSLSLRWWYSTACVVSPVMKWSISPSRSILQDPPLALSMQTPSRPIITSTLPRLPKVSYELLHPYSSLTSPLRSASRYMTLSNLSYLHPDRIQA